jgi:hypothetical protein
MADEPRLATQVSTPSDSEGNALLLHQLQRNAVS